MGSRGGARMRRAVAERTCRPGCVSERGRSGRGCRPSAELEPSHRFKVPAAERSTLANRSAGALENLGTPFLPPLTAMWSWKALLAQESSSFFGPSRISLQRRMLAESSPRNRLKKALREPRWETVLGTVPGWFPGGLCRGFADGFPSVLRPICSATTGPFRDGDRGRNSCGDC